MSLVCSIDLGKLDFVIMLNEYVMLPCKTCLELILSFEKSLEEPHIFVDLPMLLVWVILLLLGSYRL